MTGYGRAAHTADGFCVTAEIKSVNHRFLELTCRASRFSGLWEDKLKSLVSSRVARGKVDVFLTVEGSGADAAAVTLNRSLAAGYMSALRELGEDFGLPGEISVGTLARLPDLFIVQKAAPDEEALWRVIEPAVQAALAQLVEMREREGERLGADIRSRTEEVRGLVVQVEERSPASLVLYRQRLERRMRELLGDMGVDEQRLLTEAALFADKIAVDEETVRLRSHLAACEKLLEAEEPVGRRLDFLVQEMNREVNTIGAKTQDLDITRAVVEMKNIIEKIREQAQNVE